MEIEQANRKSIHTNKEVKEKMLELYNELFRHNGYGKMEVDIKLLRRGQKEVIIHCGKEFRYVVDFEKRLKAEG